MAEKDPLRPWLGDMLEMAAKRAFRRQNRENVFGQARRLAKMFRAAFLC